MAFSDADITNVLKGVESAPPSAGTAILSTITAGPSKVLTFGRSSDEQMSLDEIFAELDNMTLPQEILDKAQPVFTKAGFIVETAHARVSYANEARAYTAATRGATRLALLHVPPQFFDNRNAWGTLGDAIDNIEGFVRFVAQKRLASSPGFNGYLKTRKGRGKEWNFVSWNFVASFLEERDTIELVFELPDGTAQWGTQRLSDLTQEDRKKIVAILAVLAGAPGSLSSKQILENLIVAAAWPNNFRTMISWANQAGADAQFVIEFAIEKNQFDSKHEKSGDTYLGALLVSALKDLGSDRQKLAELILRYNLLGQASSLAELRKYWP